MIKFNNKDTNIETIAEKSGLEGMATKFQYRVYGLKDKPRRPMIWIHFPLNHSCENLDEILSCSAFLTNNGVPTVADPVSASATASDGGPSPVGGSMDKLIESETYPITYIGLSRTIRENPAFCAKLVRTIVYSIEGRLKTSPSVLEGTKVAVIQEAAAALKPAASTGATKVRKTRTTPAASRRLDPARSVRAGEAIW